MTDTPLTDREIEAELAHIHTNRWACFFPDSEPTQAESAAAKRMIDEEEVRFLAEVKLSTNK